MSITQRLIDGMTTSDKVIVVLHSMFKVGADIIVALALIVCIIAIGTITIRSL